MNRRETLRLLGTSISALTISVACKPNQSEKLLDSGQVEDIPWWDTGDTGYPHDSGEQPDTGQPDTADTEDTGDTPDGMADTGPELNPRAPRSLLDGGEADLDLSLQVLSGTYPNDMAGYLFLVHPQTHHQGPPVVSGEGVLTRIAFEGTPQLKRRLLKTPCYYADLAFQGQDASFDYADLTRISMTLGKRNLLNTGLVPMHDRLVVTSDAGRPWEVDPESLELVTPIGSFDEWDMALPGWINNFMDWPFPLMMSTAHPVFDANTQEFFSVNWGVQILNLGGYVKLVRWNGSGVLEQFQLVNAWGLPIAITQSVHQIAVTSDHIIVMDTAFVSEMEDLLGENSTAMRAQSSDTILYIIDRNGLPNGGGNVFAQHVSFPRESAHFIADYDSSNGIIRIHVGHQCANDPSEFVQPGDINAIDGSPVPTELHGMLVASSDIGRVGQYEINASTGQVLSQNWLPDARLWGGPAIYTVHERGQQQYDTMWWLSFGISPELRVQRVDSAYADYLWREVPMSQMPTEAHPGTIVRLNTATKQIEDSYAFPLGRWPSSPTFIPRVNGGANEGYIVTTVMSDDTSTADSSGDEFWIFDAQNLEQGPLCRLGHSDLKMPLTLHSCFMDNAIPRTASYQVDLQGEIESRIGNLDSATQAVFYSDVFPYIS